MTTMMVNLGRLVMNSIETYVHIELGIGNGCNVLGVFIVSPLLHWQTSHSTTNVLMSYFIPSKKKSSMHENKFSKSLNVLQWERSETLLGCVVSEWSYGR